MDEKKFEKLVNEGIGAIPEKFLRLLDNVVVVVEDDVSEETRQKMGMKDDECLFGLYEGVSKIRRGGGYFGVLPDKITIFKLPILEAAATLEEAREIVKNTVWHEIAHHFGMEEQEIHEAEKKRSNIHKKRGKNFNQ